MKQPPSGRERLVEDTVHTETPQVTTMIMSAERVATVYRARTAHAVAGGR